MGARCPAVTVRPSKGVAVPAAQGQRAGPPEGFGLSRAANWHPPSVGPGCFPVRCRRWPPRIVGGPPGPRGHAPSPCGGHGGVSGGACVAEVDHTSRARGEAPGMAPPGPPSGAAVTRASLGESPRGGAERRRGRRRGAPASVQGHIKTGQAGPTGVGRGGRRLPVVTVPPLPLKLGVSSPSPLSSSRPRVPTRTRRPWHPRGRRVLRRRRR